MTEKLASVQVRDGKTFIVVGDRKLTIDIELTEEEAQEMIKTFRDLLEKAGQK